MWKSAIPWSMNYEVRDSLEVNKTQTYEYACRILCLLLFIYYWAMVGSDREWITWRYEDRAGVLLEFDKKFIEPIYTMKSIYTMILFSFISIQIGKRFKLLEVG